MKKLFSTLAMTLAVFGTAKAIVVEQLVLKNGTVLNGYFQSWKGDQCVFQSDNATVYLNRADISEIKPETAYNLKDLPEAWVKWAEENDEFDGSGDNRILRLTDIVAKDRTYTKVKILSYGEVVKFLEMTPNAYTLSWKKQVKAKVGTKRAKTDLSGINVKYLLKDGTEYDGQFAEDTDSTLSVYLNNGMVQNFKAADVVKYTYYGINPNQDIFEQSPLLSVVKTKSTGAEFTGIIIEENYGGAKSSDNYVLLQQESGAIQSIKVSDVESTRKEVNPKYAPKTDVVLKDGQVMINRSEASFVNVKKEDQIMILESVTPSVNLSLDASKVVTFNVEYRTDGVNVETFQLVRVTKMKLKKQTVYGFTYEDLAEHVIRPLSIETSVNHTTKAVYRVAMEGGYVLYDKVNKRAIPISVK